MNEFIKLSIKMKRHRKNGYLQIEGPTSIGNTNVRKQKNLEFFVHSPLRNIRYISTYNGRHRYSLEQIAYDTYNKDINSVKLSIQVILDGYVVKPLSMLFNNQILLPLYKMAKGWRWNSYVRTINR